VRLGKRLLTGAPATTRGNVDPLRGRDHCDVTSTVRESVMRRKNALGEPYLWPPNLLVSLRGAVTER